MNTFEKDISKYWLAKFPKVWSFLGSLEGAKGISKEHKDQIHFINEKGTALLKNWIPNTMFDWQSRNTAFYPFSKTYFKSVEQFKLTQDSEKDVKKWLHNRNIPFSKNVFIYGEDSVMLTWKMVIKYCENLFFAHDTLIIDNTLSWALFFSHNDVLSFAKI